MADAPVAETARAPTPAASVILVRDAGRERNHLEVFLVKRHRKSSFMSSAFVFPGGKIDAGETSESAAIRELFEEAGVLLAAPPRVAAEVARGERARLLAGEVAFADLLADKGLALDSARLHWWARWVTPSAEPRRFDAQFFIAELPPGQLPSFDRKETVEEVWLTPAEALERQAAGTLRLAPPQLRTFHELAAVEGGIAGLVAAAALRRAHAVPIRPRLRQDDRGISIVLPWDPSYSDGFGEGEPIPATHLLATPPSRFVWTGSSWEAT